MEQITIEIPRGMLYYRYETLWKTFFTNLGTEVCVREPITYCVAEQGMSLTVDEACLLLKLYFGHVSELIGKCDYIFIPRTGNFGRNRDMCPRFHALYDLAKNIFRDSGQKFLTCNVNVLKDRIDGIIFLSAFPCGPDAMVGGAAVVLMVFPYYLQREGKSDGIPHV